MELLLTKFELPLSSGPVVDRVRLVQRLDEATAGRLTVVAAAAGAGKTTLAAAWRQSPTACDRPVAWLTLEPRDSEPRRFWSYFTGSLDQVGIDTSHATAQMSDRFDVRSDPDAEPFLNAVLNALAAGPSSSVIVLDDFHYIVDATVLSGVEYLIDHLPRHAHLVMLSRRQPPLSLETLRLRSALEEIDGHDLRFTNEELKQLFREVADVELTTDETVAIAHHTEGWAAAAKLGALSLRRSGSVEGLIEGLEAGSPHYLSEFLVREVLDRQDPELRAFLLESAILGQFTEEMANAITDRPDAESLAERVRHEHLFLERIDQAEPLFRYHPLFAAVVARELRHIDPARYRTIRRRASTWFETRSDFDRAVEHAAHANDGGRAVALALAHLPHAVGILGATKTVRRWVEILCLGGDASRGPRELAGEAWALALTGHPVEAASLIDEIDKAGGLDDETSALVAFARSFVAFEEGDSERILDTAQDLSGFDVHDALGVDPQRFRYEHEGRALMLMNHDEEARIPLHRGLMRRERPHDPPYVMIPALLAHLDLRSARLSRALRWTEISLRRAAEAGNADAPVTTEALSARAGVRLERGDLGGAQRDTLLALDRAELIPHPWAACLAMQQQARIHAAQGDHASAAETLDSLADRHPWGPLPAGIRGLVAREQLDLAIAGDDRDSTARWSAEIGDDGILSPAHQILTALVLEDPEQAAERADRIVASLDHRSTRDIRLRAQLAAAQAFARSDRHDDALRAVGRATELAEPEQMVQVFRCAGPDITDLVNNTGSLSRAVTAASPRFVEQVVLQLTDAASETEPADGPAAELLSERELSVLRLLPSSLSLSEIADELYVSHNTVKTHVKHIYRKMGTRTRAETVDRSRASQVLS